MQQPPSLALPHKGGGNTPSLLLRQGRNRRCTKSVSRAAGDTSPLVGEVGTRSVPGGGFSTKISAANEQKRR
jgi:hypothetical protein